MANRLRGNRGQELSSGDTFCPNCGALMREAEAAPPLHPQRSGGWSAGRVLLLVLAVPVLLAVALFVFEFAWGFLNGLAGG